MTAQESRLTLGEIATLAIIREASSRKAGNVHPAASFVDMTYDDFVRSAIAIGPAFDEASRLSVGEMVLQAIVRSRAIVPVNTNLGTLLLLAPLAKAAMKLQADETLGRKSRSTWVSELQTQARTELASLSRYDSLAVYEAIRVAKPGGLGKTDQMDVQQSAPDSLIEAMRFAADFDLVARQYDNGYRELFDFFVLKLLAWSETGGSIDQRVRRLQIEALSQFGDSLVLRKCGPEVNAELQRRAAELRDAGLPGDPVFEHQWDQLDHWLRSDGHRRNPGTIADLIAAALFVEAIVVSFLPTAG